MQFLTLRVRIHEFDDKLSTLVLKTTCCDHDDMARTKEYGLIVAKGLVIVRGVYGRPWIGKHGTMIDLLDNLYLIAYLDSTYRFKWQPITELTKLATVYRYVKGILAGQNINHKEFATDNGIRQRYVVHHLRLLLTPHPVDAGITHYTIVAKIT